MNKPIRRALVSVWDKEGLSVLLPLLDTLGVRIVSSGGTYDHICQRGYKADRVEDVTGYPHMLGGRVKTLHPNIFGGILARQGYGPDEADLAQHRIEAFDLVVVNLYPFAQALAEGKGEAELVEMVDIGGVSLIRAAAKNYQDVLVVTSPSQYEGLAQLLTQQHGETSLEQRQRYAALAFSTTASYDAAIAQHFLDVAQLPADEAPIVIQTQGVTSPLRYGENPHQRGTFCGDLGRMFTQLHGKEISYNNLLDLHAGIGLIDEFEAPTVAILKHGTPCGLATAATLLEAWEGALATDPTSAFGGVILANGPIEARMAERMHELFFEVCLAPDFSQEALALLGQKKNRILLRRGEASLSPVSVRSALNGYLVQEVDNYRHDLSLGEVVTDVAPTPAQLADLLLANRAVKHCKSNAIVLAHGGRLIGVGAGETSRVDALQHAIDRAQRFGHTLRGAVLASDAYFPFRDSVTLAAEHGIAAIVQPGGSVRDQESIEACNGHHIAMLFTGHRHFKH